MTLGMKQPAVQLVASSTKNTPRETTTRKNATMDLGLIRQDLAEARASPALSDRRIARQIEIIDELDGDGHATEFGT
jgi:hypothetical protein